MRNKKLYFIYKISKHVADSSSDTLKLRILNTNAVPHSNIDKQIFYNSIIETENDENVSSSNEVKDVESDTNLTLEHNISSSTTPERYFYNTIYILYLALGILKFKCFNNMVIEFRESFGDDISLTLNSTHEQPSTPKLNIPKR